jgi:hypothetical protein
MLWNRTATRNVIEKYEAEAITVLGFSFCRWFLTSLYLEGCLKRETDESMLQQIVLARPHVLTSVLPEANSTV